MDRESLQNRLTKFTDNEGVKITFIANETHIPANILYNLRSDVQKSLSESYAISLHEYLSERDY